MRLKTKKTAWVKTFLPEEPGPVGETGTPSMRDCRKSCRSGYIK